MIAILFFLGRGGAMKQENLRSVALVNRKGGVGKTTLAVILAEQALKNGETTYAVDLDPQKNFTDALSIFLDQGKNANYKKNLHVYAPDDDIEIEDQGGILIVDCPPAMEDMTLVAIEIAETILVPVMSDVFSVLNLEFVFNLAEKCGKTKDNLSLVRVGFKQMGLTLPPQMSQMITESDYKVLADVPMTKMVPINIASGRLWSTGLTAKHRKVFVDLYKKIME